MKRASPETQRDSASPKRRSTAPPSPPRSLHNSPELSVQTRIANAQRVIERELNAKFETEYKEDILSYMKSLEIITLPSPDMMDLQPELEWYMRPFLLDFLIEVVFRKHYQLLGCTALWIAAKYEEAKDKVPLVKELRAMCCDSYREQMFLQMEGHVLKTLEWNIGAATTDAFLQVELTEPCPNDTSKTLHLARLFTELALFHREFVCYKPNTIAQGSLSLSRQILGQSGRDGQECLVAEVVCALRNRLPEVSQVLTKKYAQPAYESVAVALRDFLEPCEKQFSRIPPSPLSARINVRHQMKLDTVTPARNRQSHAYSHGMITPPLDTDDHLPSAYSEDQYDCSSSEASLSPVPSSCASILDSYHQDALHYKSQINV